MDTRKQTFDVLPYRLKSARRKKRLQKKDFEKQLIQLFKKRELLWQQRINLPMVPLDEPFQRGWKRDFVFREDQLRSPLAEFYQNILLKINTVQYDYDRTFKHRKTRRKQKRVYGKRVQKLAEFTVQEWEDSRKGPNFNEAESLCFQLYEAEDKKRNTLTWKYRFIEPWRFVLRIRPHIITELKMKDPELEREIRLLDNHIEGNDLYYKMERLRGGLYAYQKWTLRRNRSYRNTLYRNAYNEYLENKITEY
ncbi:hypothetical protein PBAL39_12292 [Pedobacter sp. BAL39]|uniref:hypothetical protein n=1 Tax=Pedobacter sp. BAL39 TaxID=391596 RepID=UPI000155A12A|nr:hypothetical protein [Pedobacter sp. BAL39]EDM36485.1 hypothetical protein PBAL39_12292 [Pedobacter sp. BAL39]